MCLAPQVRTTCMGQGTVSHGVSAAAASVLTVVHRTLTVYSPGVSVLRIVVKGTAIPNALNVLNGTAPIQCWRCCDFSPTPLQHTLQLSAAESACCACQCLLTCLPGGWYRTLRMPLNGIVQHCTLCGSRCWQQQLCGLFICPAVTLVVCHVGTASETSSGEHFAEATSYPHGFRKMPARGRLPT
jgi:hypothetical protein